MTKQLLFLMNRSEAEWFSRQVAAAEAGDGGAACLLGDCYRTGRPVAASPRRAFRWYLRGAWAGDGDAMNNLGACYHNGYGCQRDIPQAVHWYQRAAEAGSVQALDNLGRCYRNDDGVSKDTDRAAALFRKAHAKGHQKAGERLVELGLERDQFKKALKDAFDRELIDVATQDEYDCAEAVAKMYFPDRQFTEDELWELEAVVDDYMFSPEWEGGNRDEDHG